MKPRWLRRLAVLFVCAGLVQPAGAAPPSGAPDDAAIIHALNRLTWGPRPGDVERVRAIGLDRWIELQLHPEGIPDAKLEGRLASLRTADLSTADLRKGYEIPPAARREFKERQAALGDNPSEAQVRQARREIAMELMPRMEGRPQVVIDELQEAKILRAVYSERQLDDVLVDFWMNHFNVYAAKGPDRFLLSQYERDTIRPRAWGKFEDLLRATAESPAMLFYLDNWLSADPNASLAGLLAGQERRRMGSASGGFGGRDGFGRRLGGFGFDRPGAGRAGTQRTMLRDEDQNRPGRKRGLNENYGREIMELHTLGVDGGYTQKDVTEVARCFTGWTMQGLRDNAEAPRFVFVSALHDRGDKLVLGHVIKGGGKNEGDQVIHILATHPSTARFVATKLARRFVADDPPPALVERAAEVFTRSDGDIRAMVAAIVSSPEFLAADARAAKVKTPLEFVVSAVRATGASVLDARDLAKRVAEMGMPLYMQQPPTGYKDTAEAWVSTSGLLARLNFALDLAAGRVQGTLVDASTLRPQSYVPGGLSATTRATLEKEASLDTLRMAGMILGSPEFQRK